MPIWHISFLLLAPSPLPSSSSVKAKTAAIASRIGALAELVQDGITGLLFEPGQPEDLAQKMLWAQQHPEQMAAMGRNARALYEAEFTAERNCHQLMAIYQHAIAEVVNAL